MPCLPGTLYHPTVCWFRYVLYCEVGPFLSKVSALIWYLCCVFKRLFFSLSIRIETSVELVGPMVMCSLSHAFCCKQNVHSSELFYKVPCQQTKHSGSGGWRDSSVVRALVHLPGHGCWFSATTWQLTSLTSGKVI